jgi:acylphosphatase
LKTYRLIISGTVQGVNYRASARKVALELRLSGTVRNLGSGDVEAIISGDIEQLHNFIEWAKKGPAMAEVSDVRVEETAYRPFDDFTIIRSKDI